MSRRLLRRLSPFALFCAAIAAPGCGPEPAPPATAAAATPAAPAATAAPGASAGGAAQAAAFENPGGMWMPEQMPQHAERLRALGLQIDPNVLADPTAFPLGAVVSLGGCSASFVSAEGLVATNHHCTGRALLHNTTPEQNLQRDGYLAKSRAEERWAGPTARVYVTRALRDVTREIRDGLAAIPGDLDRYKKMEDRKKALVAACEKGRPEIRCSVSEYFGGAEIRLVEQLEIRDVRLVYVPPEGVGNFGGEIDNWRWPRHAGDFAFLRAYVGKDGRPADHAPDNVPYRPARPLKIAAAPLQPGDLVMVAGYPGRTNRLRTAAEVEAAVSWQYPEEVRFYEENIALLEEIGKKDAALRIKADLPIRGLSNRLTKTRGLLDGLAKGGLAKEKAKLEAELEAWIDADGAREAAWGDVVETMAARHAEHAKTREHDRALEEALDMVKLLSAASTIVRMAEERAKPDAERDPEFQERNWKRLAESQQALQKAYDRRIDRSLLALSLRRMARLPEKDRPALLARITGGKAPSDAVIDRALGDLYARTKLEDEATRIRLLQTATTAELQKSADPMIRLAVELRPVLQRIEDAEEAYDGAMTLLRPKYVEALRKLRGGLLAPDANRTLRLTYGTVRGYTPEPKAEPHRPFTMLGEMVTKSTGKDPFEAPPALLATANAKKLGPYVDPRLGDVPVDFLSDLDITGGNSGSATLNARGELVGLAFDGNYESMASDWLFMPAVTRTIHVDVRYVLWVMDALGADNVVRELGGKPALD